MSGKHLWTNKDHFRMKQVETNMQRDCKGCYYYSGWNCDYILFEKNAGHARPGINAR